MTSFLAAKETETSCSSGGDQHKRREQMLQENVRGMKSEPCSLPYCCMSELKSREGQERRLALRSARTAVPSHCTAVTVLLLLLYGSVSVLFCLKAAAATNLFILLGLTQKILSSICTCLDGIVCTSPPVTIHSKGRLCPRENYRAVSLEHISPTGTDPTKSGFSGEIKNPQIA